MRSIRLLLLSLVAGTVLGLSAASAAERHDVRVVDDAYDDGEGEPAVTQVAVGDRVAWYWAADNEHQHTVTSLDGGFDSDRPCGNEVTACRSPGYVFTHTFTEPGTYRYRCEVHLTMLGTVEVRTAASGGSPSGSPSDDPSPGESTPPGSSPTGRQPTEPGGEPSQPAPDGTPAGDQPSPSPGTPPDPRPSRGAASARRFPGLALASPAAPNGPGRPQVAPEAPPTLSFEPFPEPPSPDRPTESATAVEIPAPRPGPGRRALTGIAAAGVLLSAVAVGRAVIRS